jgi:hypothetical protein
VDAACGDPDRGLLALDLSISATVGLGAWIASIRV